MAHIKRKFIDKHWIVFVLRGALAFVFGLLALTGQMPDLQLTISFVSVFLLAMGIIDSSSALYNSTKKRGWGNSVIDAAIDVIAALLLLFFMNHNILFHLIVIALYTFISGVIDLVHSFITADDSTDRFIRILSGICGIIMGFVIVNAGEFEVMTFIRFFGVYLALIGTCSLIYGIHNRAQYQEDKAARSESAKKAVATKATKKAATKKATTKKSATKKTTTKKTTKK